MTAPSSDTASMNFNPLIPQYSLSMNESVKFVAIGSGVGVDVGVVE